jgi:parallel beta-helix repeat protein
MAHSYPSNTGKGRNGFFHALTFTLLIVAFACTPAFADPTIAITECGTIIGQPGHYILANDLNCGGPVGPAAGVANPVAGWGPLQNPFDGSTIVLPHPLTIPNGIDIIADHVDLLLNGHTIDGGGSGGIGISVGVAGSAPGNAHVHILGPGTVTGFGTGLLLVQATFSSVREVTATDNGADFVLSGFAPDCAPACSSTKNDFQGNTAANSMFGFLLQGADDNTLRDNNVSNTGFGIVLAILNQGNDVRANTASNNAEAGIVLGFFGIFNVTDNDVTHNTALNNGVFDLFDFNGNCTTNTWKHNTFVTAGPPCIQ